MVMPAKDLTGHQFGYLTVIRRAGSTTGASRCATWECRCLCGNMVVRASQYLRAVHRMYPRSCGCHHGNETHKMTGTALHHIWLGMRRRCRDLSNADYGGRGILVHPRWEQSFEAFYADMGAGYARGLTLGRVDNSGPYAPNNCRWETPVEQANNRRSSRFITTPKGRMTIAQAARAFGIAKGTLYARIVCRGWPIKQAVLKPTT